MIVNYIHTSSAQVKSQRCVCKFAKKNLRSGFQLALRLTESKMLYLKYVIPTPELAEGSG